MPRSAALVHGMPIRLSALLAAALLAACAAPPPAPRYASSSDWVEASRAGTLLILAEQAGVWSERKTIAAGSPHAIHIRSRFVRHAAQTCYWDVEFVNPGSQPIDQRVTLVRQGETGQYRHLTTPLQLSPRGSALLPALELRDCGDQPAAADDMSACAACRPQIGVLRK